MMVAMAAGASAQTLVDGSLSVSGVYTSGPALNSPTGFVFIGPNDLLITEKATGEVCRMTGGVVQGTVANVSVNNNSERGLLGIVLDPEFSTNNYVYVYYTWSGDSNPANDYSDSTVDRNRIARFTWNPSAGSFGALENEVEIIALPVLNGPNHDGGVIIWGPPSAPAASQKLYAVIGDLNRSGQNQNNSSGGVSDDSGVILRLEVSKGAVPTVTWVADNPFVSVPGANDSLRRTYAYGVRNSYGILFDPLSSAPSTLWITENGPSAYDEINVVAAGFNSGWKNNMGPLSAGYFAGNNGSVGNFHTFGGLGTYSDPEFSFQSPIGITAAAIISNSALGAAYQGDMIVGDVNTGRLYKFEMNGTRTGFALSNPALTDLVYGTGDSAALSEIQFGSGFGAVTDMKQGPDGALYVLTFSSSNRLLRISGPSSVGGWEAM